MSASAAADALARYEEYWAKYKGMLEDNKMSESGSLARLNLVAWAGEALAPRLAKNLYWALDEMEKLDRDLDAVNQKVIDLEEQLAELKGE